MTATLRDWAQSYSSKHVLHRPSKNCQEDTEAMYLGPGSLGLLRELNAVHEWDFNRFGVCGLWTAAVRD